MSSSLAVPAALFGALLFIIISAPAVYQVTNKLVGGVIGQRLADQAGNPTRLGLVVHALVYFAAFYGYARLNKM